MKESVVFLISVLLCFYLGCYRSILLNNQNDIKDALGQEKNIISLTKVNNQEYLLKDKSNQYTFTNDTLYTRAKKVTDDAWQKFEPVKLPIDNIRTINIREINPPLTGIAIGVSAACAVASIIYISKHIIIAYN